MNEKFVKNANKEEEFAYANFYGLINLYTYYVCEIFETWVFLWLNLI